METTILSSKGQVIIPKPLRSAHHWGQGQKLTATDTGDGILLKPVSPFEETRLEEVAGCLNYQGKAKSVDDMADAIRIAVEQRQHDSD